MSQPDDGELHVSQPAAAAEEMVSAKDGATNGCVCVPGTIA